MPELPEVETVRDGLARHVLGAQIAGVQVLRDYSVRRHEGGPQDFCDQLTGATIEYAARRGKFIWLGLAGRDDVLVAHLGMSGQILVRDADFAAAALADPSLPGVRHLRVRMELTGGGSIDFVDQRTFGYLTLSESVPTPDGLPGGVGTDLARVPQLLAHIARDLLDPAVAQGTPGRKDLIARFKAKKTGIKRNLLDQELVSGVGNIYADEALWLARVHYARPAGSLTKPKIAELLDRAEAVMRSSLSQGGTSFDSLYVNVNGESGYFNRSLNVYGREHESCHRCGTPIRRDAFMNRSAFWCPVCQIKPRG